ncbi:MAG: tetratricopeptide repeat protein [Syntrophobacteraceae bacterium]
MSGLRVNSRFAIVFALLFSLTGLFLVGCSTKEEKVAKFIARGDKLLESGDPVKAILEYKNAMQIDPKNASARFALGRGQLAKKEIKEAFQAFRAATELDPNLDEARIEVASILTQAAMGQEALEQVEKLVAPDKLQPRVDIVKGRALVALKKHAEAIQLLRAIQDGSRNKDVLALLSVCYREVGDTKSMEAAALRWREIDPKAAAPYLLLAQHAAKQGDRKRALSELDSMVKANDDNDGIHLVRVQVLGELGMADEAERAAELLPARPALMKAKSEFYQKRGNDLRAQQVLEELLAVTPGDTDAVNRLARILVAKGNLDEALGWFEKSLKLNLEQADREKMILSKASLLADLKKTDDAKKLTEDVLKQNQGNLDAHLLMGNLLLATGKPEEAEIHLNQVAVGRPNNPNAHQMLARCQLVNKKQAMALETLKNGLKANPTSVELRVDLVRAHLSTKDTDQALKVLSEGLELKGDEVALLRARGQIYASLKEFAKAESDFRMMVVSQPKAAVGYLELGQLMLAQSKTDAAAEWYGQAMKTDEGWQSALPVLLSIHLSKNDTKTALALAEAEVAKRPDNALVHHLLGQTQLKAGNAGKAEPSFIKAAQLAPDWLEPYRALVEAYAKGGKKDKALGKMEELHKANPTPAASLVLASLMEEKGRHADATKLYKDIVAKSNEAPSVMNDIAFLLAEKRSDPKDLAYAEDLAAKALAKQPENPAFLDTVAWIAYKRGKLDDAWSHLQTALSKQPEAATLNFHSAVVANARGDKKVALERVEKALQEKLDAASQEAALKLKKELEG